MKSSRQHRGEAARLPLVTLGSISFIALGCAVIADFDPVGDVARIDGQWLIDDRTPTEADCLLLRNFEQSDATNRVRVTFLDGERPVAHSGLVFRCDVGNLQLAQQDNPVVAEGSWTVRLDALDSSGDVVASGPRTAEQDASSGLLVAETANFYTRIVRARYHIHGQRANRSLCNDLGITDVRLTVRSIDGAASGTTTQHCLEGMIGLRVPPPQSDDVQFEAELFTVDTAGTAILRASFGPFDLVQGEHVDLLGMDLEPIALDP